MAPPARPWEGAQGGGRPFLGIKRCTWHAFKQSGGRLLREFDSHGGSRRRVALSSLVVCVAIAGGVFTTCEASGPVSTGSSSKEASTKTTGSLASGSPTDSAAKRDRIGKMTAPNFIPVVFSDLTGWADDDHLAAFKAFLASCPLVIAGKAGRASGPDGETFAAACGAALALQRPTKVAARAFFEEHFQPHRIVHKDTGGLLTGYYEPVIDGSRKREARFQTPILKRPADLVTIVPETRGAAPGSLTHARRTAAGLVPFSTRAEIDAGALAGQNLEILYLSDPVEKFFLQIQGSGRIRLTDGTTVRVQYDGKNGHPYTSIGRYLIDKGLLAADKVSMGALGRWLKSDLERARSVMNQNASYVFFRELPPDANGPLGAIQVPLVAGRSLAIDPAVHRLGRPIYVSAPSLTPSGHQVPFNRLMVAHDVGSAIKGPERGDIYFGSGETAERQASRVRHPGNLFVLVAKATAATPAAAKGMPGHERRGR